MNQFDVEYYVELMKERARRFYVDPERLRSSGAEQAIKAGDLKTAAAAMKHISNENDLVKVQEHLAGLKQLKQDMEKNVRRANIKRYNEVVGIFNRAISFFEREVVRLSAEASHGK